MRKLMLSLASFCAMAYLAAAVPAQAQILRTYVSISGSNTGDCPITAPCRNFGYAITQTTVGGEIDCLSGGDFGTVTITQSVTIDCGATQVGGIGVTSGPAVNITATSGTVVLRNLALTGFGASGTPGSFGIYASGFNGTLIVLNSKIQEFVSGGDPASGSGIYFGPSTSRGVLEVSDTAANGNYTGVYVEPQGNVVASVVLNRIELNGNEVGLFLTGQGTVAGALRQSVVAENSSIGVELNSGGGVYFTVEESSVLDNLQTGILSDEVGVNVEVGASTIGGNGTGVKEFFGSIYTFGNNQMSANGQTAASRRAVRGCNSKTRQLTIG